MEPGVKLGVSSGPKSAGPPRHRRAQLSQRVARGEGAILQRRKGFDPNSEVQNAPHNAFLESGSWTRSRCSFHQGVRPVEAPGLGTSGVDRAGRFDRQVMAGVTAVRIVSV